MPTDDTNPAVTNQAVDALLSLSRDGRALCPPDVDPDEWASAVLFDLARIAELLDGAVTHISGRRNDTVAQNARALAAVIGAHRNLYVGASES